MATIARTGKLLGFGIAVASMIGAARADDDLVSRLGIKGLIDLRGAISSDAQSWENGGLGKTRYGGTSAGDRLVLGTVGEATLILQPQFTWDLTGYLQLTAAPEQHTSPDVIEAYLQYKPAPSGPFGVRLKAGVFFPPISLENTGLGWTSPYTISPSAINTWVGEELRTIGGEATVFHRSDEMEVSLTGAAFGANDATGTMLAWRGWTISDRKAGLMDQLNLPALSAIRRIGIPPARQQPYDQPFTEIDGRVGYYVAGKINLPDVASLSVMRYDNRADDKIFGNGQWAWRTSFWAIGATADVGGFDLLSQGMSGTTSLITLPTGPLVYADLDAAYGMVSRAWGRSRLSFRFDWFRTEGDDLFTEVDEHGHAFTLAYIFRPGPHHRLTLELLHIDSTHSERQTLGLPERVRETQAQISYRFFF